MINSELEYADFLQHKVSEKTKFIYQKFIGKNHEYRVVVMGENVAFWYEKFPGDSSKFRYNSALGAKEVYYDVNDIPRVTNFGIFLCLLYNLAVFLYA